MKKHNLPERTSHEVREALKKAGAHKVSIRRNPFNHGLCGLYVAFDAGQKPEIVGSASVYPPGFHGRHKTVFLAISEHTPCWLSDKDAKLI